MCAWTVPATFVTGEIVLASKLNLHIRDNTRYLKGLDGVITLEDSVIVQTANGKYLQVPSMTTANRPATPANGMVIYNTTKGGFEKYEAGAWTDMYDLSVAQAMVTNQENDTAEHDGIVVNVPRVGGILMFWGATLNTAGTATIRFKDPAGALVAVKVSQAGAGVAALQEASSISLGPSAGVNQWKAFLKPTATGNWKITNQFSVADAAFYTKSVGWWVG